MSHELVAFVDLKRLKELEGMVSLSAWLHNPNVKETPAGTVALYVETVEAGIVTKESST